MAIVEFYEYNKSHKLIVESMSHLGIEIDFTGKLGVRTKYQEFEIPQLVVEINRKNDNSDNYKEFMKKDDQPTIAKLDDIEDNILYETPVFTSVKSTNESKNNSDYYSYVNLEGVKSLEKVQKENMSSNKVSLAENICMLALIKHMLKSKPIEDMLREEIMAYVEKSLEEYSCWSVLLNHLIIRSDLEFRYNKKLDRAMMQYEAIMEDANNKKSGVTPRIKNLLTIRYPNLIEISTKFANNYIKLNSYMSASIIFEEIELWEKAVQCKIIGGNPDQAMKLLKKLPQEIQESPQMLCVFGDVKNDIEYYKKAWLKSNKRLARAQRALAKHYFYKKDYDQAIVAFKESLKLNRMDINSLSNLGYIYLQRDMKEEAINCYNQIISLDENQSMAWANLSTLYRKIGKMNEAFKTSLMATRKNEKNVLMLCNLMNISFDCKDYTEFVKSILKIINMEKSEILDEIIFKKLNFVIELLFTNSELDQSKLRNCEINYIRVQNIYMYMVKRFPLKSYLWDQYINYIGFEFQLLDLKRKTKLEADSKGEKVFFYTELTNYQEDYNKLVNKKYKVMQKRIHVQMEIGWQDKLEKCEHLQTMLEEHYLYFKTNIGSFTDYKKLDEEFRMQKLTIEGFIQKILNKQ